MVTMKRFTFTALVLAASLAVASPKQIAMPVGHTTTVVMPSSVVKVKVDAPSLVDVKRKGRKVTMVGLQKGMTDVTVTTLDGEKVFHIFVAADRYAMPQQ